MQIEVCNERPVARTLDEWRIDGELKAGDILTTDLNDTHSPLITVLILRDVTQCVVLEYVEDPTVANGIEEIDCFQSKFVKAATTKLIINI